MNFVAVVLFAVSSSTLLAVALAFLRGGLTSVIAGVSLAGGLLVAAWTLWSNRKNGGLSSREARASHMGCTSVPIDQGVAGASPSGGIGPWEWAAITAFALVFLRTFLWLVFAEGDSIKVLSPNNLGDLSLHITYIKFLASGVAFWPDNPIFTGGKLTYPVGVDLFQSLLSLVGIDLFRGLIWAGLVGSALTGVALWHWGRGFALFGFLANGGLFGFAFFGDWKLTDFQSEQAWKSVALALFTTQRGLLFALPAGLLLLCSWRARFFAERETDWRLPRWGEVLLYASMPLFHLHTFIFLSLLLGAWFVLNADARRKLVPLVGASFLPATALVLLVTGMLKGASVLGWKAGWMWDDEPFLAWCAAHCGEPSRTFAALLFWPMNFGILPVLIGALCHRLSKNEHALWPRAVVFPALLVFLLCCFVKFAPWDWDNTKLMIWSYLAVLPFLWQHLIARWPEWVRALACFALFFSGFVSTLGGIDGSHRGYEIASRAQLAGVASAVRGIPVAERFVGAPTYNHPLLLCGRKMALGYTGHVASHGLDWQTPAVKIDALMRGAENWRDLASQLGARFLYWGQDEEDACKGSPQPWKTAARHVASGEWGDIYDLQTPPAPPAPPNP